MRLVNRSLVVWATLILVTDLAWSDVGTIRMSWDQCDPPKQRQDFAGDGSGQIATLVLSVIGSDVPNNGHRVRLEIGPGVDDAWRFDADGCQAGRLQVTHDGASPTCPAYQGTDPLGLSQYSYDSQRGIARLDITNTYDAFTPVPTQRYTLWQARFDHSNSVAGAGDPSMTCGFADNWIIFALEFGDGGELLLTDGHKLAFAQEVNCLFWNTSYPPGTPGGDLCVVQVQPTTWGRIKSHYR
jgi:hypothetical protein